MRPLDRAVQDGRPELTIARGQMAFRYAKRAKLLEKSVFDNVPGTISLNSGAAYPPLLPDVGHEAAEAVGTLRTEAMQYAPLMGLDDLRTEVCEYVAADGVSAQPENILITYGAKSAFDLALRVFVEPGDQVIVTRPTYMSAVHIIRTHQARFLDIGQDDEGFDTAELEDKLSHLKANGAPLPKLLFDVPDFHNPTSLTTSLQRRRAMVELAQEYNFIICEDDPYRRIRFCGNPVAPIKTLDDTGHVIALGTVSKILAPGLRVGWALGDPGIIRRMALQKADGGSNAFAQRIVVQLMRSNKLAHHVAELTNRMREHRDIMMAALAQHLPEAVVREPEGGYFLWAKLPEGTDAETVAAIAIEEGVEVSPGSLSYPNEDPGNCLRLAYSFAEPANICRGIEMVGRAYRRYLSNSLNRGN